MQRFLAAIIILCSTIGAFAQGAAPRRAFDPSMIFMMIAIFVIMYFFILRPQMKKQKETQAMLNAIKKSDKVLTVAGIVGVVTMVKDTSIMVKVAENTVLEFKKAAITAILSGESEEKSS